MVKAEPRESVVEAARQIEAEYREGVASTDVPPRVLNAHAAASLATDDTFQFREHTYRVSPLPWAAGVRLLYVQAELERMPHFLMKLHRDTPVDDYEGFVEQARPHLRAIERSVAEAVDIIYHLSRVEGGWLARRRYRYRNPFEGATMGELMALLGFFSDCRMKRHGLRLGSPSTPEPANRFPVTPM